MYVEFTLSQTMEQFLAAHVNAFNALGVPKKLMVDNLRSAVLRHPRGECAEFNPRYLDFARHYGFEIVACAVAKGNEKGRVERGVGYVKGTPTGSSGWASRATAIRCRRALPAPR